MSIFVSNSCAPWVFVDGGNDDDDQAGAGGRNKNKINGLDVMTHYIITC